MSEIDELLKTTNNQINKLELFFEGKQFFASLSVLDNYRRTTDPYLEIQFSYWRTLRLGRVIGLLLKAYPPNTLNFELEDFKTHCTSAKLEFDVYRDIYGDETNFIETYIFMLDGWLDILNFALGKSKR